MRRTHSWLLLGAALLLAAGCGPLRRLGYAGPGRDSYQQPERVVESLAILPGSRVADLGAGGGYFTWRLAEAVGATGVVYAIDVDPDMTSHIAEESREKGFANVQSILAEVDDPRIPAGGVDLIFTCNTYHHLRDREEYFRRAAKYLRPGGRLAIIEYEKYGWVQRIFPHYTDPELIRSELEAAGYRRVKAFDYLERQSFQIFEPADG
jgi:ubiquinone/menaquinone biosynthesis C-methylase UbiE